MEGNWEEDSVSQTAATGRRGAKSSSCSDATVRSESDSTRLRACENIIILIAVRSGDHTMCTRAIWKDLAIESINNNSLDLYILQKYSNLSSLLLSIFAIGLSL